MLSRLTSYYIRTAEWSRPILLSMGLVDEVVTGIPVVALPLLREQFGLSYAQVGLLFTASAFSGMLLEPFINLFSDRGSKKPWILGGLLVLAIAFAIMGNATSYALLLLAFVVYFPAGGAATDLSQAVVMDAAPGEGVRTMTRWTLLSSIGDFLAPLLVAAFVSVHMGWSALCWLASTLWLAAGLLLAPLRFPSRHATATETAETSMWANLRAALRDPLLLRWAALALIPIMLDEVFLGFAALYLRDVWHLSEALIALVQTAQMLASFFGLFLLERMQKRRRFASTLLLTWLALAVLLGVFGLLFARMLWLVIVSLLVIDLCGAGWYPLATAEAYATRPTQSGVVRTIISLGLPFDMLLPGVVGLVATRFGILASLGVLGLAPVLVLLLLPKRHLR